MTSDETPEADEAAREDDEANLGRMIALTDGVVAIALTLLILGIAVPTAKEVGLKHTESVYALADALGRSYGSWIAYVVSFYVIAQFWLLHRHVFRGISGHREALSGLNFVFLFTISVMPFTSDLVGQYAENPLAVIIFSGNMILASLTINLILIFSYRNGLLSPQGRKTFNGHMRVRSFVNLAVYVISIPVALWNADAGKLCWLGLALAPRIGTVIHQRRPSGPAAAVTSSPPEETGG